MSSRRFLARWNDTRRLLWSDERIAAGSNWEDEISEAMERALAAVLLVSADLLHSDFIAEKELPFLLKAAHNKQKDVLWVRLTPCLHNKTPLRHLQAAAGMEKPLISMARNEWMEALCHVCEQLDEVIKKFETPVINEELNNQRFARIQTGLKVLAKPAYRKTEVLLFSGDGWHRQTPIGKV
jgi:hypothetical protein